MMRLGRDYWAQRVFGILSAEPERAAAAEIVATIPHDGQPIRFVRSREGRLGLTWAVAADCEAAFGATLARIARRLAERLESDEGAFSRFVLASAAWAEVDGSVALVYGPALFGVSAESAGLEPSAWVKLLAAAFMEIHRAEVDRRGIPMPEAAL
jgi:hypothetical protein